MGNYEACKGKECGYSLYILRIIAQSFEKFQLYLFGGICKEPHTGTTRPDALLAAAGLWMGYIVQQNIVAPNQLADYVRNRVCRMTPEAMTLYGTASQLVSPYYEGNPNFSCPRIRNDATP